MLLLFQWKAEAMAGNDVLLLQDGNDEPDFVSGEYDFDLLD